MYEREKNRQKEMKEGGKTGRKEERTTFTQAFKQNGRETPGRGMEEQRSLMF